MSKTSKKQVVVIHGGETFSDYQEYLKFLRAEQIDFEELRNPVLGWKQNLAKDLGESFEVIRLEMPNKVNAKYIEWQIWFEKYIPHLNDEVVLVGHSLGGTFLVKYLGENNLQKKIKALLLVAPPHDDKSHNYSLADFIIPENLEKVSKQCSKIFIYHSEDDTVVPFEDFLKYKEALPNIESRVFKDRGHFYQSHLPEIVKDLKESF